MRKAQIKGGIVANIIVVDPDNVPDWCVAWPDADAAAIGDTYFGGVYSPPAVAQPTRDQQEAARQAAYVAEADPLFFMAQRGEATMEEWEAKVAEIKARFPYPEQPA